MKSYKLYIKFLVFVSSVIAFAACKQISNLDLEDDGIAEVNFNFTGVGTANLSSNRLASSNTSNQKKGHQIIGSKKIDKNNELVMVIEEDLSAQSSSFDINNIQSLENGIRKRAEIKNITLESGIGYLVVVFNKSDSSYVNEAFYTANSESSTSLKLASGKEYIFVAFTYNLPAIVNLSTNILTIKPKLSFKDNIRKLSHAIIDKSEYLLNGNLVDLSFGNSPYYYQKVDNYGVLNSGVHNLNLLLRQQQAIVKISLDLSKTNYPDDYLRYTNIRMSSDDIITSENNNVNLNTGLVEQVGAHNPNFNFQSINNQKEYLFNLSSANVVTDIIGDLYRYNLVVPNLTFENITLSRGTRYTLTLKIKPTDRETFYEGYPAVLINGKIWMKHLLGADTTAKFEGTDLSKRHYGNYYFWGSKTPIATVDGVIAGGFAPIDAEANSWNIGTEENPKKNETFDPCPSGWRVPTESETLTIINDIDVDYYSQGYGTINEQLDNYTVGFRRRSIRNGDVFIVYPATGYYNYTYSSYVSKGITSYFINSGYSQAGYNFYSIGSNSIQTLDSRFFNKNHAYPVRCIAE